MSSIVTFFHFFSSVIRDYFRMNSRDY